MPEQPISRVVWRKSSYSNGSGGNCVEVAAAPLLVAVRDSCDRQHSHLAFNHAAWQAFITAVKTAELGLH